jgi:hypothetical protein
MLVSIAGDQSLFFGALRPAGPDFAGRAAAGALNKPGPTSPTVLVLHGKGLLKNPTYHPTA